MLTTMTIPHIASSGGVYCIRNVPARNTTKPYSNIAIMVVKAITIILVWARGLIAEGTTTSGKIAIPTIKSARAVRENSLAIGSVDRCAEYFGEKVILSIAYNSGLVVESYPILPLSTIIPFNSSLINRRFVRRFGGKYRIATALNNCRCATQ